MKSWHLAQLVVFTVCGSARLGAGYGVRSFEAQDEPPLLASSLPLRDYLAVLLIRFVQDAPHGRREGAR